MGVVGRSSAESVAYFMLSLIPAKFAVAVLFVVACFVSTAMGTSVGTITLIAPIAAAVSDASGFDLALCVGSVMGGAMFGDNLSFISDTTIAACNGPVSYTHLDVYKRQGLASVCTGDDRVECYYELACDPAWKYVQYTGCLLYTSRCV